MEKIKKRKNHKRKEEQEEVIVPEIQYKKEKRRKKHYGMGLSEEGQNIERIRASKRNTHVVIDRMEGKSVEEKRRDMKRRVRMESTVKDVKEELTFPPNNTKRERRLKREINKEEKKKHRRNYKFSNKTHPISGIISVLIAILELTIFGWICIQSGLKDGSTTFAMGLIGILLLLISVLGFVLAAKSFKKNDIHFRCPMIGLVLNGVMIVLLITLYVLGLVG